MEEQDQVRHNIEEGQARLEPPTYTRPWRQRIWNSLKARGAGYFLIAFLLICGWLTGHYLAPRDFFFTERAPELSYPYHSDSVPAWSLAFIAAIGPLFFIILSQTLIRWSPRGQYFDKRTKDIHLVIIVLGEVLSVTWLITNILKCYVGRLRPDFFAYCNYKGYRTYLQAGNIQPYLDNTIPGAIGDFKYCIRDHDDAHFSFPSGHASLSFCGLAFLTLFLLHVTSRINFRHHSIGKVIRFFIVLVPLFAAALVAASRIINYKHHVEDTIWGALIGLAGAFLAFHANYGYKRPDKEGVPSYFGEIIPHRGFHRGQKVTGAPNQLPMNNLPYGVTNAPVVIDDPAQYQANSNITAGAPHV